MKYSYILLKQFFEISCFRLILGGAIKIACVFHEQIANMTALTVAKNELHIFIPNDADLANSLGLFVYVYSLRNDWNQEHWILDVSGSKSINDSIEYLKNLKLDLDDDLFLLTYNINHKHSVEVNIWEHYEIHSSVSRKVIHLGGWNPVYGLNITKLDKWTRRSNLEVNIYNSQRLSLGILLHLLFCNLGNDI